MSVFNKLNYFSLDINKLFSLIIDVYWKLPIPKFEKVLYPNFYIVRIAHIR